MFFNSPGSSSVKTSDGQETKTKKIIYLTASIILGLLLSLLAHSFIEIRYLNWMQAQGRIVSFYGSCALSPKIQIALWLLGALGGYFLGRWWWRMVYVKRTWVKREK